MTRRSIDLHQVTKQAVRERLDVLSTKTFSELAQLPKHGSEDVIVGKNKVIISIWHDALLSQEHRIVVQAYNPGILGIGRMQADGFALNNQNDKRPLTLEEWAPFS